MNAFLHAVFSGRHTNVRISKEGNQLKVEIDGVGGERIIVEVNSVGELKLEGLGDGEHSDSN